MVAVQYNSMKTPKERDTRDIWTIRHELAEEKKLHSQLLSEIRELDNTLQKYASLNNEELGEALEETVEDLHQKAGMTELKGPGIVIDVNPSPESIAFGLPITGISSELLTRLVNEINRFNGHALEIDGKRFTMLSSIRDINGVTTVNGLNIAKPPFQIKIVSSSKEESERMYNYLLASTIQDEFYLDNLVLHINKPETVVKVNGWTDKLENNFLEELTKGDS